MHFIHYFEFSSRANNNQSIQTDLHFSFRSAFFGRINSTKHTNDYPLICLLFYYCWMCFYAIIVCTVNNLRLYFFAKHLPLSEFILFVCTISFMVLERMKSREMEMAWFTFVVGINHDKFIEIKNEMKWVFGRKWQCMVCVCTCVQASNIHSRRKYNNMIYNTPRPFVSHFGYELKYIQWN